jgi:hypothetical protein
MIKTSSQTSNNKQKQILDLLNELKLWSNSPSNKSILKLIKFENDLNDEILYDLVSRLINKFTISLMKNDSDAEDEANVLLIK